jgi:hypothetical protein
MRVDSASESSDSDYNLREKIKMWMSKNKNKRQNQKLKKKLDKSRKMNNIGSTSRPQLQRVMDAKTLKKKQIIF